MIMMLHSVCCSSSYSILLVLLLSLITLSTSTRGLPKKHKFNFHNNNSKGLLMRVTTDLIHRDSPQSPLYDPSKSKWEHVANAITRSHARANYVSSSAGGWISTSAVVQVQSSILLSMSGEYLMNISIGTPPVKFLGIVDTGSDLMWTQCDPCLNCYNQTLPTFNPNRSSSFKPIPCNSDACYQVNPSSSDYCSRKVNVCEYHVNYGDKSYSVGDLISETLTFGYSNNSVMTFPEMVVGCGHNNGGTFGDSATGIIGLGGGPVSLIRQLGSGKFSYCLVPAYDYVNTTRSSISSKITFGWSSINVTVGDVVSTRMMNSPGADTFYIVKLVSITIGEQSMNTSSGGGGDELIIVDSGTTLTYLPRNVYSRLEDTISNAIDEGVERAEDPWKSMRLCYKSKGDGNDMAVPVVKLRFDGGGEIKLKAEQIFISVAEDVVCLAMAPGDMGILGNIAQTGFVVGFDLDGGMVSFQPDACRTTY